MPRRAFFSFHYAPDIWRAMNVRNSWIVRKDDQIDRGFFDASVFEATRRTGEEVLKAFLRDAVDNSSVTCILAGENTWRRRWVRYEIARSLVKGNGLLTVFINGLRDRHGQLANKGANPLSALGVYRAQSGIFLAEWKGNKWVRYSDYTLAIPENDLWFSPPIDDRVVQLHNHCRSYDFVAAEGRTKIGSWIEAAAVSAGR
jgi:hypothetical protein